MSIAPTEAPAPLLTHADRCDACSARAYVLAIITWPPNNTGELYFCAHDWRRNEAAIRPLLGALVDERWQLDEGIKDDRKAR